VAQILLIDHNPQIRLVIKALIEAHPGWHICGEATDGQEGVDKAIELKPDLVVLDFSMPALNGFQVAEKIFKVYPSLPLVLCTIHYFQEMIAEAKKVGIREVVDKANEAARLLEVIEALLEENPQPFANAISPSPQPELADPEGGNGKEKPPELN
jgi:DNA-binding NarL/FixJ family response regulator